MGMFYFNSLTMNTKITLNQKIDCLRRELRMRERVYPRQVTAGKMRPTDAALEIEIMTAVLNDYERQAAESINDLPLFS